MRIGAHENGLTLFRLFVCDLIVAVSRGQAFLLDDGLFEIRDGDINAIEVDNRVVGAVTELVMYGHDSCPTTCVTPNRRHKSASSEFLFAHI